MLNVGKTISKEELERYDYLRAEYYKENGRWPYTPRPLTNYEKAVISKCGLLLKTVDDEYIGAKRTYADFYFSELKSLEKANDGLGYVAGVLLTIKNKLLPYYGKAKNFSREDVVQILFAIHFIYEQLVEKANKIGKVIGVLDDESKSILGVLDNSEYYREHKTDLAKQCLKCEYDEEKNKDGLKDFYFDPNDIMLLCSTVLKSIPQNARDEIKNRKTYLSNKKSRDYSDFMDMRKKMIELYNKGKFTEGDELLREYTGDKYRLLNGAARHSFNSVQHADLTTKNIDVVPKAVVDRTRCISEDLFIKTVIELSKLREKLKNSKGVKKTFWERWISGKYLYRGLPLYKLLERTRGGVLPKEWKEKKVFEESLCDEVIKYLTGKTVIDLAASSTSLSIKEAQSFLRKQSNETGSLLVIDVLNYDKGQDLVPVSQNKHEQEVLLPMGVKLKIKSVSFKKEGSIGYFEVNCVPE